MLASGGCSAACETRAEKYSVTVMKATENSFREEWGASYSELSGCDSWDSPSVTIWFADNIRSSVEVAERMKMDRWESVSQKDAVPYDADFVLKKDFEDQVLVAAIRDSPGGGEKEVEVLAGD